MKDFIVKFSGGAVFFVSEQTAVRRQITNKLI